MTSKAQLRQTHGVAEAPILANRVMVKDMSAKFQGMKSAKAVLAFNDKTGTYTSVNVYQKADGQPFTGPGYDRDKMTFQIPAAGSDKAKKQAKEYTDGEIGEFAPVIQAIEVPAEVDA